MSRELHVLEPNLTVFADLGSTVRLSEIESFYGTTIKFEITGYQSIAGVADSRMARGVLSAVKAKRLGVTAAFARDIYACWGCAFLGITTIYDSHFFIMESGTSAQRFAFRSLLGMKPFRGMVVTSRALYKAYSSRVHNKKLPMLVAYNGADDWSEATPEIARASDRMQVGYIGHLYPGKGMELIEQVAVECPFADFHIIGGTSRHIEYWRSRFKPVRNAWVHGFVAPAKIGGYLTSMDIVLAPYQHRSEVAGGKVESGQWMTPLKIFDGMGAARVVIASRLPVAEEILDDEVTGFLCNPEDASSWRDVLLRLKSSPSLRRRVARKAHSEYINKFTWRVRAEKIVTMFNGA